MKIHSLMIPDPITITESASIQEAIELMKVNSIRHLPVVLSSLYAGRCISFGFDRKESN
jgi:CBS domain-containing protein